MTYSLTQEELHRLESLYKAFPLVPLMCAEIRAAGGKLLLVGGAVRDVILGHTTTEVDVEVYHLSFIQLQNILERQGIVTLVGKSFGVLRIAGVPIDWSLPRKDQAGRHPHVELIPNLSIVDALRRRDVTMNAMAIDVEHNKLYDPFKGRQDIMERRLRTPDPHFFVQDPLRFYRVMQFISRFQMIPDEELNTVCRQIDISTVSRERIGAEFDKLLLLSRTPSWGLRWLLQLNRLHEVLPELDATVGILQDMHWHPEGDVFEHTMQAIDIAAQQTYPADISRRMILFAVLCHDLGKAVSTHISKGKIRSIGHEETGVPLTRSLIQRITGDRMVSKRVALLVRHHMAPGFFVQQEAKAAAYKRLAHRLAPYVTLRELALVAYADKSARNPQRGIAIYVPQPDIDIFIMRAQEYGVLEAPEAAVLSGQDVAPHVKPGPDMGKLLQKAYELQISEGIRDKQELLRRILGL